MQNSSVFKMSERVFLLSVELMAIMTAGGWCEHIAANARVQQSGFPFSSYALATTAGEGYITARGFKFFFIILIYLIILYIINMNRLKIAERISTLTNPPIITIPLFLIICIVLSFDDGVFNLSKFIALELISLVFASVLPMAIILYWAKKLGTDKDISNRSDRSTPLIVGVISYFIGFLISLAANLSNFMTILLLCYSVNTLIVMIITLKWKISVHTTGLSGPIGALILLLGPFGAIFAIIYPIVIWSRVLLKKHTMAQAICGAVQGFFLTIFEMYIFVDVLNLPVGNIISLYIASLLVLAIIATPVLLGFLSYVEIKKSKLVFYLLEIILAALFYAFAPLDVFIIYALITVTSVSVSYFAGEDFIWYKKIR